MPGHGDLLPMQAGKTITIARVYWDALHTERTELLGIIRTMQQYLAIERKPIQEQSDRNTAERLSHAGRDRKVDDRIAMLDRLVTQANAAIGRELPSPDPRDHGDAG